MGVTNMIIRYISPNGEILELKDWPSKKEYLLQSYEGFGEDPVTTQMQKAPFQDGRTLIDQLLEPRELTLSFVMFGNTKQEIFDKRRAIQKMFNPVNGLGTIQWEQDGKKIYEIDVVADGTPQFPSGDGRGSMHQTALINFIAPNPLWRDEYKTNILLINYEGGLSFPSEFPLQFGVSANSKIGFNEGDIKTPVYIEIIGPLVNPIIQNEAVGQKLSIQRTLESGEKIVIKTGFGEKEITLIDIDGSETNVMHWLTGDSEFFNLAVGENILTFNESSGAGDAGNMTIEFYQRYVGV